MKRVSIIISLLLSLNTLDSRAAGSNQVVNTAAAPTFREGTWWIKAHNEFVEIRKKRRVDLLFVGDSITAGWMGWGKTSWDLYFAPRKAFNFGVSGDETGHLLWRLQHGEVEGTTAKVIILLIGTNNLVGNSPEEIAEGISAILQTIRSQAPRAQVLLMGLLPRQQERDHFIRGKLEKTNKLLAKFDDAKCIKYLDAGDRFLLPDGSVNKELMPDYLHPNAEGYRILGEVLFKHVYHMLKTPVPTSDQQHSITK